MFKSLAAKIFGSAHNGGHHNKKKALTVVLGLAGILLLAFSVSVAKDVQNPASCAGCHVMQPYFYTWQSSPHSNVSCLDCHVEPGTGFASVLAQRLREVAVYRFGEVSLPIQGTRAISSEACLECHSNNRVITPGRDIRAEFHVPHLGYGTSCADCHADVAHAGVGAMEAFQLDEATLAGFKTATYQDFALTKTSCTGCHDGERVTYNCEVCHEEENIPQNHFKPDFGYRHGPYVREDVDDCMRCHTGFGKVREVQGTTIAEKTRNARFCRDCHEGARPVTHDPYFSVSHKIPAARDQSGCMVCHDWTAPPAESPLRPANIVTCGACHDQVPAGHDRPRWYWDHKVDVREKGSFACFECHGATSCFECHTRENVGFGN
jgi:nitrate/TMAO reductase-like tetraheme cytochrome c subunit